jgi:hypothetical protein
VTAKTDGRDIDIRIAELSGEAAQQKAGPSEPHMEAMAQVWEKLPAPEAGDPTYYDRPVLKKPVWEPYIALYYYIGGAAGASLALGAAAQLDGSHHLDRLVRRCHWIGIIGSSIGGALLVADLGKPLRFLYMLRVFRPTSPMNMGAWVLAAAPSAAFTAGMFVRRAPGLLQTLGEVAGYSSGVFGMILATYTGVLIANSAVPIWQAARRELPALFGASAVTSAASIFDLLFEDPRASHITRVYGIIGRGAELAAGTALERSVSRVERVGEPLKRGVTGALWRASEILTAASLVALMLPKQNRGTRVVAGVLGTLGSIGVRFAVHYAGFRSAADPRASFHQQRAAGRTSI